MGSSRREEGPWVMGSSRRGKELLSLVPSLPACLPACLPVRSGLVNDVKFLGVIPHLSFFERVGLRMFSLLLGYTVTKAIRPRSVLSKNLDLGLLFVQRLSCGC